MSIKKTNKFQSVKKIKKEGVLRYKKELRLLQIELLKLQNYVKQQNLKIIILFEGIDLSGKSGTIKKITQHLNPRRAKIVALEKPNDTEKTQWYFQRYTKYLPSAGEIVFFDRSWYNRGGVEPVMGFCTQKEHFEFLKQVPKFEKMLVKSNILLLKFYLSVSKKEAKKRFKKRKKDPLKRYKLSSLDEQSLKLRNEYTNVKFSMLMASNKKLAPWIIVRSDNKKKARINCIKHILTLVDYPNKINLEKIKVDKNIIRDGFKEIKLMKKDKKVKKLRLDSNEFRGF